MEHINIFNENIKAINRLVDIHEELTGRGAGYRSNVEVLNKSGIVLLVACWEAFVEDLASHSFEFLLAHATTHNTFPAKVLTQASKAFWDSKDERGVWSLAGDGWHIVLESHRNKILNDYLGNFNTPRAAQIDTLFESLLGLSRLSSNWKWRNMSAAQAKKKLGDLITLRGAIAHRVSTSRAVTKKYLWNNALFVAKLVVICSDVLRAFIYTRTGEYPWMEFEVGFTDE